MPMYRVKVVETARTEYEYLIEADSPDEARVKAEMGETVEEEKVELIEVSDRSVIEGTLVEVKASTEESNG